MANEVHIWRGTTGDSLAPGNWDTDGPATQATGVGTFTGVPANNDTVRIQGTAVKATGILTLTANATNTKTVTIDTKVYTFQDTLTNTDGNVLIGGTASDSIDNLIAAIMLGAGSGTKYAADTTLHPTVTALAGVGDTMDAEAKTAGTAGNSIVTDEALTDGSWGGGTLAGGTAGILLGGDQTYTWKTTLTGAADEVKIGGDLTVSRQNLVEAVNALPAGNAGVTYGSGTVANVDATAIATDTDKITLTSVQYGTDLNSVTITDPVDAGSVFSWGASTLAGGLTNWATDGTVEVIFEEGQNQDMNANMNWLVLLSPLIDILRVTKKRNNSTTIASSGTPWRIKGVNSPDCVINLQGFGDCSIQVAAGSWTILQDLVGELTLRTLLATVSFMEIHSGACDCYAEFLGGSGGLGTRVQVTGDSAVLDLLGTTLRSPGIMVIEAGIVTNERDMAVGDWAFIGERGTMIDKGVHDSQHDGIVALGKYRSIPRAENPANGLSVYGGNLANLDFADAEFVVNIQNGVIGRNSEFNQGRISNVLSSMLDLREIYP